MLSRFHALLTFVLSCKLETAEQTLSCAAPSRDSRWQGRGCVPNQPVPHEESPGTGVPSLSQARGTEPGHENSWAGAHGGMKWPILVLETPKSLEIKRCTLLLREKAAFLFEISSTSLAGREQNLQPGSPGLGRTFPSGLTSQHSTSPGLGSSANIPAGRTLYSSP